MAEKLKTASVTARPAPATAAGSARAANAILRALPRKEQALLLSKSESVSLPAREILSEMGAPIEFCYFLKSGVVSIIQVMNDGKSVEVGLTGKEGFIGLPVIIGYRASPTRAVVQIAATAQKIRATDLKKILNRAPKFNEGLQRYAQELAIQAIQIAACNRLHDVDKRLARWLLMSQDRVEETVFPLTQEFISHMLGTRRASVTVAAGALQKAGLINYSRGLVTIKNRSGLESASCECYATINKKLDRWHRGS